MSRRVARFVTGDDGSIENVVYDDGTTLDSARFVLSEAQATWCLSRLAAGEISLTDCLDELAAWATELPGSPIRRSARKTKTAQPAHVSHEDLLIADALKVLTRQ